MCVEREKYRERNRLSMFVIDRIFEIGVMKRVLLGIVLIIVFFLGCIISGVNYWMREICEVSEWEKCLVCWGVEEDVESGF